MDNDEYMNILQLEATQRKVLDLEVYLSRQEIRNEIKVRIANAKKYLQKVEDACDMVRDSVYSMEEKLDTIEQNELQKLENNYYRGMLV